MINFGVFLISTFYFLIVSDLWAGRVLLGRDIFIPNGCLDAYEVKVDIDIF